MQEMLGQVRKDMEELQASRDFWEERALNSDDQIQTLRSTVIFPLQQTIAIFLMFCLIVYPVIFLWLD